MHIALLNYAYDPGYASFAALLNRYTTLTDWAESLLMAGAARVTVVQRYQHAAELVRGEVRYLACADGARPLPRLWSVPQRMHRLVVAQGADLVHVNGLLFPLQVRALRRGLPGATALVVQDHAGVVAAGRATLKARIRRLIDCYGLRAADALLFTTAEQAQPWRAAGIIAPAQPVYDLLESSRRLAPLPRAEARVRLGLHGDPLIVWVGRLNANKDPLAVLAGFAQALPQLPGARLAMSYQTADLLPEVQAALAQQPQLAARVDLLGELPFEQVVALLSAADLFVLGSHREGSGYALLEAIACGAVPVVTDIPSFRAITGDGRLGRLWPPGDAAALARALAELGSQDRAPLQAALARHFAHELSWEAVGRRALAIYREVWAARGRSA